MTELIVDPTHVDLYEYIKSISLENNPIEEPELYRYVLYARRSTKDKDKQERSLPDQIDECLDLAKRENLKVVKPYIQEKESAKDPDVRPKFRKMIDNIKSGKYEGILAWHPNRLARNMKEAGEIIDLIDKGIIKDLKFPSFSFENSASGKVMLGITFVLSKQYSDALSKVVKRGLHKRADEGGWLTTPKHGYYKDDMHKMHPDKDNFVLIKEAWRMRLNGSIYREIADYLNSRSFCKPVTDKPNERKPYEFTKKRLSEMFSDPIYAGVMRYGKNVVDLIATYDFNPVVSVPNFLKINNTKFDELDKFLRRYDAKRVKKNVKGRLINGKIACGHCKKTMHVSITSKAKGSKFYYKCGTKSCFIKNKSGKRVHHYVRAKVIVDFIVDFLREAQFDLKEMYKHYVGETKKIQKERLDLLKREKKSIISLQTKLNQKSKKIKEYLLDSSDDEIKEDYESDLKSNKKKIKDNKALLVKIDSEIEANKVGILTFSKFTEQMEKLPDEIVKTKVLKDKNYLIEKIFANLAINNKKVATYQLNEPFATFFENPKVSECRLEETDYKLYSTLAESIRLHWNIKAYEELEMTHSDFVLSQPNYSGEDYVY